MPLMIEALPADVQNLLTELKASVAEHRDLKRKGAEGAAAEPVAARALEAARAAVDEAEVDFALATDETESKLRSALDRKRRECREAEEALRRLQLVGRGILARTDRAADAILTLKTAFGEACAPFCQDTLAAYRKILLGSLFGTASGGQQPLARVLRLGWALLDALPFTGSLRSKLEEVSILDMGPVGNPVPRLIQGERIWPDDGERASTSLRDWQHDPEIVALHAVLKPLGAIHAEAAVLIRRIEAKRALSPPAPPPNVPQHLEPHPSTGRQPTAEEHRALMREEAKARADAFGAKPPVEHTYHGNRFANDRLA